MSTPFSTMRAARRTFVLAAISAAAMGFGGVQAADYPSKPIKLIVPFTAGSGTDIIARVISAGLQDSLKTSVVVENLPGASGQIAASAAAKAKPDGYTIFFTTNTTQAANVSLISETPFLLLVRKDMPVKDVKELVAWLKANPAQASYGYGNSTGQVSGAAVMKAVGVNAIAVPYKGTPAAASDVIGGRLAFIDTAAAQAFIGPGGPMRPLAITSAARSSLAPDVPTLHEATGVEGLDLVSWLAVYAPAGTPTEIIGRLKTAIHQTTTSPEFAERIKNLSSDLKNSSPEELGAYSRASIESWRNKIKAAGIEPQ